MKKLLLTTTALAFIASVANAATFPGINHDCKSAGSIEDALTCQAKASWSDGRNSAIEEKNVVIDGLKAELAKEKAERLEDFHHLNDRGNKFKAERDLARDQLNGVINQFKVMKAKLTSQLQLAKMKINIMKSYINKVVKYYGWKLGFPKPPKI